MVEDVKQLLRIIFMFLPVPFFVACFDQQFSTWVLQAVGMDGRVWSGFTILPDQMQSLNPLLVLILVFAFDGCLYPLVGRFVKLTLVIF